MCECIAHYCLLNPVDLLRLIADLLVKGQNPPAGPQSLNSIPRKTHCTRLDKKNHRVVSNSGALQAAGNETQVPVSQFVSYQQRMLFIRIQLQSSS